MQSARGKQPHGRPAGLPARHLGGEGAGNRSAARAEDLYDHAEGLQRQPEHRQQRPVSAQLGHAKPGAAVAGCGYEVTIHERPITESGWTGAGYTAIDPSTGAGAYTIEGGSSGGWLLALAYVVFVIVAVLLILPVFAAVFALFAALLGTFAAAVAMLLISSAALWISAEYFLNDEPCAQSIFQTIASGMSGSAVGLSVAVTIKAFLTSFIVGGVVNASPGVLKACVQQP